jgi:choline dehydrogenase
LAEKEEVFDYIVVGAGAAGSVMASRLCEDAARTVLVLEAGAGDGHPFLRIPAAVMRALATPRFDWGYQSEPDPTRQARTERWPRGKVLGGSASINGMVFVRGQAIDYDDWARGGASGWSYAELLPFFRRMEATSVGEDDVRGRDGPVSVVEAWAAPGLTERFIDACADLQIPRNPDYNGHRQEGAGLAQANLRHGARDSSARAYLIPALRRPNLAVRTRAHVGRLVLEGRRVVGVEYHQGGRARIARCRRDVVLCAGAIASPQLLMLSGVGPPQTLRRLGIPVVHDLAGVGENLMDHPAFSLTRGVRLRSLNQEATPVRQAVNGARWLLTRKGPATAIAAQAVAFVRTRADLDHPDVQLHFASLAYTFADGKVGLERGGGITVSANVSRPRSRGRVTLKSASFRDPPAIHPAMFAEVADLETLARGVRVVERIFDTARFRQITVDRPYPSWASERDLHDALRAEANVIYHPAGTCRMGAGPDAVVDARLRGQGLAGLRIADTSVFPSMVSGNTNAAAMVVAERGSDLIKEDERRPAA